MDSELEITERYQSVLARIDQAAKRTGRDPGQIRLVVVTKGQPLQKIRAVVGAGARFLGENYVEEAQPKIEALAQLYNIEWHMIGHVQSRKAAAVARYFTYIHSVDRVKLANRLNRFAAELGRTLPILLEYNVSGESTKFGWDAHQEIHWDQLLPDVEKILELPHLKVCGLMTMAPFFREPELARPVFKRLCMLREYLSSRYTDVSWDELSMGMSADFEVAVEEGATMVRIGEAVLGPRP